MFSLVVLTAVNKYCLSQQFAVIRWMSEGAAGHNNKQP